MDTLVIVGASGHGKVVADAAIAMGKWSRIEFLDARWPSLGNLGPWPVVGSDSLATSSFTQTDFVVAIGKSRTRLSLLARFKSRGWTPQTIVHPSACISPFAQVGAGSVLCAGFVVGPFARLGEGCIVNTCASVDHDCLLGDGVHIAPGAHLAGDVEIGEHTWIGIGASVIQGLHLSSDIMVGAGATVVTDLEQPGLYLGTPARRVVATQNK